MYNQFKSPVLLNWLLKTTSSDLFIQFLPSFARLQHFLAAAHAALQRDGGSLSLHRAGGSKGTGLDTWVELSSEKWEFIW